MPKGRGKQPEFYDIATEIWNRKYRYKGNQKDIPEDKTVEDTLHRVARTIAANEQNARHWESKFEEILIPKYFLPGGRIIANAGTQRSEVTMFNCYVMNSIEDSIEGIFDTVKDSAVTQKQGGGVGFDFSTIRPKNSHIKGCEAQSSGPISFMQVLDSTCRTIMSAGQRRGAQMGVMRCDHPDIEEFVTAKRGNASLQMFNLSVAITEKFMNAVKNNSDWELSFNGNVHKTVRATELWELIMKSTYDFAEPGFILMDRINEMNNLYYCETIAATNPCGEQPLPPFGACLLGSLNLTKFVNNPFEENASVDYDLIDSVTRTAVRLLDNVIDISGYPLPQQRDEARRKRRMGVGITGLADMFIFLGVRYGSAKSLDMASDIMKAITNAAYEGSVALAKEKGSFPLLEEAKYCRSKFIQTLPDEIIAGIKRYGLRNSHLISIAPTGTISLFADNVSSGLEPVFAFSYNRRIRNGAEDDCTEVEVVDYAYKKYVEHVGKTVKEKDLPDYFVTSDSVTPEEHVNIQAALQRHVDSSISKTINVPADYPFDKFKDIYLYAHSKGLKGCTTFRPSEHITGVLTRKEDKQDAAALADTPPPRIPDRPKELEGTTYKIKTPLSPDALYLTINDIIDEGTRRPYELFINTKNLQHLSWVVAMTRLISAVFRKEKHPSFLVEELKSIYDPNGGYFSDGKFIPSLAADIGLVIEKHLQKIGMIEEKKKAAVVDTKKKVERNDSKFMICPQCNEKGLYSSENCVKCILCGYSKCG
ncbi:MAG: adenosylcobalamin-dependent ribonucleoside-diphosphate reductase [Kiritimatiellaeota bacterium]|nr:adenosylcobalamin-dependent ribonucleoside-diphosphate reductase [Kiritimatiellota bacterium]